MYQITKIFLFPISLIFGFITSLRNFLYDFEIIKSKKYRTKIISVGNLIMGGSGKSPMVEYISKYFIRKNKFFSIISRGYGRKTKGLFVIGSKDNYTTVGDEPIQFFNKFSKYCKVIVTENRNLGLLLNDKNEIDYAILDDAFQNRSFESNYRILLSSSQKPFYSDHIFPLGKLRESKSNAIRADILIFTKCPENLTKQQSNDFVYKSRRFLGRNVPILFSCIDYKKPIKIYGNKLSKNVVAISSIAYPNDFFKYVEKNFKLIDKIQYPDHYIYKKIDLENLIRKLDQNISILTTEKDAVKLCEYEDILSSYDVYYVPIKTKFLFKKELSPYLNKI